MVKPLPGKFYFFSRFTILRGKDYYVRVPMAGYVVRGSERRELQVSLTWRKIREKRNEIRESGIGRETG